MVQIHEVAYNSNMRLNVNIPIELNTFPDIDMAALCRQTRDQLGLERTEMAKYLGVSYGAYEHYESGRRDPSSQVVAKLFLIREQLTKATSRPLPAKALSLSMPEKSK